MIGFDEALAIVFEAARPLEQAKVAIDEAAGLVLAAEVVAAIDSPRRDVSSMDGYAVREADLNPLPARLRVAGSAFAGEAEVTDIAPGTCARIFTGGALPAAADRVVIQEIVERDGEWALVASDPGEPRFVRRRASDFAVGDVVLPAGSMLSPRALVAAAAADVAAVLAWRRPRFMILGTGDELAAPGRAREYPGFIPESISVGVAALGECWGGEYVGQCRVPDEPVLLEKAAGDALERADLVVVTGGASVGERDFAKSMFASFGPRLLFSKVAIKPGKPVWLAQAGSRLVLGLPGNPTSAMVTARLFLAPLLAGLAGRNAESAAEWIEAPLAVSLGPCGDRETFARGRWSGGAIEPLASQDSGAQQALADADVLIRRRVGAGALQAGDRVEVLAF